MIILYIIITFLEFQSNTLLCNQERACIRTIKITLYSVKAVAGVLLTLFFPYILCRVWMLGHQAGDGEVRLCLCTSAVLTAWHPEFGKAFHQALPWITIFLSHRPQYSCTYIHTNRIINRCYGQTRAQLHYKP